MDTLNTFEKVRDIFYSGGHAFRGDRELVLEIAFLVDEKYLALETVTIASKKEYLDLFEKSAKLSHADEASGGSLEHMALKVLTGKYLQKLGHRKIRYEHPFCGYVPDVMSGDSSVIGECGQTQNPEKMLTYFRQGNVRECIQIPYPNQDGDTILGYRFTASSGLNDFLTFIEAEKNTQIKNILRQRREKNDSGG